MLSSNKFRSFNELNNNAFYILTIDDPLIKIKNLTLMQERIENSNLSPRKYISSNTIVYLTVNVGHKSLSVLTSGFLDKTIPTTYKMPTVDSRCE